MRIVDELGVGGNAVTQCNPCGEGIEVVTMNDVKRFSRRDLKEIVAQRGQAEAMPGCFHEVFERGRQPMDEVLEAVKNEIKVLEEEIWVPNARG